MDPMLSSQESDMEKGVGNQAGLPFKMDGDFQFLAEGDGAIKRLLNVDRFQIVEFHHVNYTVGDRQALTDVSGGTRPKEMLTILGPTKSGKSKLLNVIAGSVSEKVSKKRQQVSGDFTADGDAMFHRMRPGFATRAHGNFLVATVREELTFSAALRLPEEVPLHERQALVDDIILSLGLSTVADTMVKKLTPLQKRLLVIGYELASIPNLLLLDEPTHGLDQISALTVIRTLNALARSGACVVICTLQLPTSPLLSEISHILFLAKGNVIYQGDCSGMSSAFAGVKLICPPNANIIDYALAWSLTLPLESLPSDQFKPIDSGVGNLQKRVSVAVKPNHPRFFLGSAVRHRSFQTEFYYLLLRELRALKRDPRLVIGRILSTGIVMTLCACVFLHGANQNSPTYFIGTDFGSFVFPLFSCCFSTMVPTVMVVAEGKAVFVRERSLNVYGAFPYMMAKVIPELFVNFVVACVAVFILYWAAGWVGNVMMIVLTFYLVFLSCVSWGYFLAMAIPNAGVAMALCAGVLVPQLLFMGTFVRIDALPIWLIWVTYLCNITYGLRMIIWIEYINGPCVPATCGNWANLVQANMVYPDLLWLYILILVLFFVLLRLLAFFVIERKIRRATRLGEL